MFRKGVGKGVVKKGLTTKMTCVMFTVPVGRLSEMYVANGPCVPREGRKRSLVSVHRQDGWEMPEQTAALYQGLTGRPANDALDLVEHRDKGRLFQCSAGFVNAMAEANTALGERVAEDKARGDRGLTTFVSKLQELDDLWMATGQWPSTQKSTRNKLVRLGWARIAKERGQALYCWYGPSVSEYVVVAGSGAYPGKVTAS